LNINRAGLRQLEAYGLMDDSCAVSIVRARDQRGEFRSKNDLLARTVIGKEQLATVEGLMTLGGKAFSARYHVRTDRRYGSAADDDIRHYDGSPLGMTQRLSLAGGSMTAGAMVDKDKYEPSAADLSRFYLAYRSDRLAIIGGDFHVSSGYGLTLDTRPVFGAGFDAKAAYAGTFEGVRPAVEARENSGFRGLGMEMNGERLQIILFGAYTGLDAIVDDEGDVTRLSDSGLHRTEGEKRKDDSVTETALGGGIRYNQAVNGLQWSLGISGYSARYDRPFMPELTARDRFQMTGDRSGAVGIAGGVSDRNFKSGGEISFDHDRHAAWKIVLTRRDINSLNWDFCTILYHYPADYINRLAGLLSRGRSPQNRSGAAMLFGGRCNRGPVNRFKVHLEVERRPWRTYTVPTPLTGSRGSLELGIPVRQGDELILRYRRRSGTEGHGEEAASTDFEENRLRMTLNGELKRRFLPYRFRLWFEGAERWADDDGRGYGAMGGLRIAGRSARFSLTGMPLRYYISTSFFSTPAALPLYIGEAELPDRLASVRVSGHGFRWAGALVWRRSRLNWLAVQVARTQRVDDGDRSGDVEVYLSMSLYLDSEYGERNRE